MLFENAAMHYSCLVMKSSSRKKLWVIPSAKQNFSAVAKTSQKKERKIVPWINHHKLHIINSTLLHCLHKRSMPFHCRLTFCILICILCSSHSQTGFVTDSPMRASCKGCFHHHVFSSNSTLLYDMMKRSAKAFFFDLFSVAVKHACTSEANNMSRGIHVVAAFLPWEVGHQVPQQKRGFWHDGGEQHLEHLTLDYLAPLTRYWSCWFSCCTPLALPVVVVVAVAAAMKKLLPQVLKPWI